MNQEILAMVAGTVLSLLFSYLPGLAPWFDTQTSQVKAGIMAILIIVVGIGAYALSCVGPFDYFTCDETGAWSAVQLVLLALVSNQGVYQVTKNF